MKRFNEYNRSGTALLIIDMMKTQEQYRELLEQRLEQIDELNFGRVEKALAGGALALAGAAGMQHGASHVTPQEGHSRVITSYNIPVSGEQLAKATKEKGIDLEVGNFPPHKSKKEMTRYSGFRLGQNVPHTVRGFFDTQNKPQLEVGQATYTKPPGTDSKSEIITNTGQRFVHERTRTKQKYGQPPPFSTKGADSFDVNVSSDKQVFNYTGYNRPTPSVAGSNAAGAAITAAGIGAAGLAQAALRRKRRGS